MATIVATFIVAVQVTFMYTYILKQLLRASPRQREGGIKKRPVAQRKKEELPSRNLDKKNGDWGGERKRVYATRESPENILRAWHFSGNNFRRFLR